MDFKPLALLLIMNIRVNITFAKAHALRLLSVYPGITIQVDEIELEKKKKKKKRGGGGVPYPIFFLRKSSSQGQIRPPPEFQLPRQTPSGRKVRAWKKKKEERRRRKNNNAKFSGHYVNPRTHNDQTHALRSHQFIMLGMSSQNSHVSTEIMEMVLPGNEDKLVQLYLKSSEHSASPF